MSNKANNVYQKHLTLFQRETIESMLKDNFKFYEIAKRLQKHSTTISKEIKNNKIEHMPSDFNNKVNHCKFKKTCTLKNICTSNCHTECRDCPKCNIRCDKFEKDLCPKLLKPPYVCNGCNNYTRCRKIKYIYNASKAQAKYENLRSSSRKGINLSYEELKNIDALISPLIQQGQSVKLIFYNHKKQLPRKISSLYNYINSGIFEAKNIHMQRRVCFKAHRHNTPKIKKDYKYKINRTYDDFKKLISKNPNINVVEMDTVIGKIEKGKVLLTLLFRNNNFMIARLIPDKSAKSVKDALDTIEQIIGKDLYKKVFKYILTDNGGEFQNPEELETSVDGEKRSSIYYCEPNRSDQKGKIEKNHEYIRYIIPKGTSMDSYSQKDIDLMISHINSTAREKFNYAIPYDMAKKEFGEKILKNLNIKKIPPDNIILKPYLIRNKK